MSEISQANYHSVFEGIKDNNETILWVEKPKFIPFIFSGALDAGTLVIGLIFIAIALYTDTKGSYIGWIFAALLFGKSLYQIIYKMLSYSNIYYGYSDKRALIRSGFIGIDYKVVDYDKIIDMEVTVSALEKLYNVGTVKFFSGRVETDSDDVTKRIYDKWVGISNPYQVFKKVKTVTVDIKTDYNFPNALRPDINPGYNSIYKK